MISVIFYGVLCRRIIVHDRILRVNMFEFNEVSDVNKVN